MFAKHRPIWSKRYIQPFATVLTLLAAPANAAPTNTATKAATSAPGAPAAAAASQAPYLVQSAPPIAAGWQMKVLAEGLAHPWSMAWLPGGEMLVTTRGGELHLYKDGKLSKVTLPAIPQLFVDGQGGLFDVSVHPGARAGQPAQIYLTAASGTREANRTILLRGLFDGQQVKDLRTLFSVTPDKTGTEHFGGRLSWLADGTLLMSVGDGGNPPRQVGGMLSREQAQNLGSHLGSILRLSADGKAPAGQPFAGRAGAKPEIWSYGHRNIQGLTRDPASGQVWASEHGPLGGDELNLVSAGQNFGWPLATYGRDYRTGEPINAKTVPGTVDPRAVWIPISVAPSGLTVYRGNAFPAWQGNIFSGNLVSRDIHRIVVNKEGFVQSLERLPIDERVRDVRTGPDGFLYALTDEDSGKLIRIEPKA